MSHRNPSRRRAGAAAVEAALVAPLLAYLFVVGVDFARVYHDHLILTNAARNGAHYACQSPEKSINDAGIQAAALNDAGELRSVVSVSTTRTIDTNGSVCVRVTVSAPFRTVSRFPGVPTQTNLSRVCQMRLLPQAPKGSSPS